MVEFKRVRGDNYPFTVSLSVNNKVIDISGDTVIFSYKNENEPIRSITGVPKNDGTDGLSQFIPSTNDFKVSGIYQFDVQRISKGYTYTHLKGNLILEDDVS